MQLKLCFSFDTLDLPIEYKSMVQGLIYRALLCSNPDYSDFIHNKGREQSINKPKLFTFGKINGSYRTYGNNIIFKNRASLEIRSPEDSFINTLVKGFTQAETLMLGRNEVLLESVAATDYTVTDTSIHAVTESPLCFKKKYPDDSVFDERYAREKLIANAMTKWLSAGYGESDFSLDIDFKKSFPQRKQCFFKGTYITGWETAFLLRGSVPTLNFIYNTGIGARNSQGFGMFDIIK